MPGDRPAADRRPGSPRGGSRPEALAGTAGADGAERFGALLAVGVLAVLGLVVITGARWGQLPQPRAVNHDLAPELASNGLPTPQKLGAGLAEEHARVQALDALHAGERLGPRVRASVGLVGIAPSVAASGIDDDLAACRHFFASVYGRPSRRVHPAAVQAARGLATPDSPVEQALRDVLTESLDPDTSPSSMGRFVETIAVLHARCATAELLP